MPDRREEVSRINEIAASEKAAFLDRTSLVYLEACVSLMLTHMSRERVALILEAEADMVRELG